MRTIIYFLPQEFGVRMENLSTFSITACARWYKYLSNYSAAFPGASYQRDRKLERLEGEIAFSLRRRAKSSKRRRKGKLHILLLLSSSPGSAFNSLRKWLKRDEASGEIGGEISPFLHRFIWLYLWEKRSHFLHFKTKLLSLIIDLWSDSFEKRIMKGKNISKINQINKS